MRKIFLVIAMIFMLGIVASCTKDPVVELSYTVSFDTGGGTVIPDQVILNGGKVTQPADPTKDGFLFDGVWKNGTFEWNFAIDIVTEDVTLVAGWIEISSTPTNISVTDELFSSALTWQQTDAELQTFTVSIKPAEGGTYVEVAGTVEIENTDVLDTVTFTPTVLPQGGYYIVKVQAGLEEGISESVLLGGAGTALNPYLVSLVSDVIAILEDDTLSDKNFLQVQDILTTLTEPIEINNDRQMSFSGVYDGGNHSLSFGGNGGLFHEITTGGIVRNLVIDATTVLSAQEGNAFPIGAIANTNNGLIQNVRGNAFVTNVALQGLLPVFEGVVDTTDTTTGAGGLVGINGLTGIIRDVTVSGAGAVKAGRGVGGVSAYNYGLIEFATVTATLPAGNQANSGSSSNTYSFGGGIAGFNFGTITKSVVSGRVFAQSAYSATGNGNEGKNVGFGGIAGYNEGLISESSFARSNSSKEYIDKSRATDLGDLVNNLGVASIHGDLYVGGIAGINAGEIVDAYVGGALIGARDYVGGVTGLTLTGGTITNTYVFAHVSIKDDGGLEVPTANDKTTLTTYEIAPSGYDVNSVFFRELLNSNTGNNWMPGDFDSPMLPEFTNADLTMVGNKFAASGVLLWQQGAVTGVDITLAEIVLPYGSTQTLEFAVSPSNAPDLYTVWTSSDDAVVEIVGEGIIKGVSAGTATITVTTRDGGYTDTIFVTVDNYVMIESVVVTTDVLTLPEANNIDVRDQVEIGTVAVFTVDILPIDADYQNYTITSSNSRAVVEGNTVTFMYGLTGPGNVSITVTFEDASVDALEYRFLTFQSVVEVPVDSVDVTADTIILPEANNSEAINEVVIGTVATFTLDFLPLTATNQDYTLTASNANATVAGNVVTFVSGDLDTGNVSITITFGDITVSSLEFKFLAVVTLSSIPITSVTVTADVLTLPSVNNIDDRLPVDIGTVVTFTLDILPLDATNQNYTAITSNSRATIEGNVVTFVWGLTGPGSVSVKFTFEDTTIGINGLLEYRFTTVEVIPVSSVTVTADTLTLPSVNNIDDRIPVLIGTVVTLTIDILPLDATQQGYTVTVSNSRATVDGNVVTFAYGLTGPGSVSIKIYFDDTTVGIDGLLEYRFTTTQ